MIQSSIIILTHNDRDLVNRCIQAVISNTNNYELIFVTGPEVSFSDELKRFGRVIEGPAPFNFAQRANLAIRAAKGEYIVLLNDDTEPRPAWLEKMINTNRILGPGIVGARCQDCGCSNREAWGEGKPLYTKFTINMFATLIPRRVLDVVGLLDERFIFYGGEDDDYSLRCLRHGFKRIISDGFVFHRGGMAFNPEKEQEELPKTRELFRQKWGVYNPIHLPADHWHDEHRDRFTKPLVSILMATRNHKDYIHAAIKSCLDQSYSNFELLIGVDGKDQDGLFDVLAFFTDPRVKVHINPERIGSCATRNLLFSRSKGEFIAIMDSDDIMLPDRLRTQLDYFSPEIDLIHSAYIIEDAAGRREIVNNYPVNKNMLLSQYNYVAGGTFLMRRHILEKTVFDQQFSRASDFEFILRNFDRFMFRYLPEPAIIYRRHAGEHLCGNSESVAQHEKVSEVYNEESVFA